MNEEKRQRIKASYNRLVIFNLWRNGFAEDIDLKRGELTEAINIACGSMLDFLKEDKELEIVRMCLSGAENALRRAETENRRLKAILARHKIKYAKRGSAK